MSVLKISKDGISRSLVKFIRRYSLRTRARTDEVVEREAKLPGELEEWLAREELLWKQRSPMDWLTAKATQRREKKLTTSIKKEDGTVVTEQTEIISEFTNSYASLFQETHSGERTNWEQALEDFTLREPYTADEVTKALFEMNPTKAPGIDGFSALFYQNFWSLIKDEVCGEALDFLNNG